MKEYLLKNVNVVDSVNETIIENTYVHVSGERIVGFDYVPNLKEIDCAGKYLMPGLINLHVHLFSSGKPSNTVNAKGDSQAKLIKFIKTPLGHLVLNMIVKSNLKTTIQSGTTTIRSVGDIEYSDVTQRNAINSGKYIGPMLLTSGYAISAIGGHGHGTITMEASTKEEFENLVVENYNKGVDWIKVMITGGVMDAKGRGDAGLYMSVEQIKWVCDKAHSLGLRVAAHVESTEGVLAALKGGVDTIEHSSALNDECVELFKNGNHTITTTISPAIPYGAFDSSVTHCTDDQTYTAKVVAEGVINSAKDAIKYGIKTGLGTDSSCPYAFHYGMWRELAYYTKYVGGTNENAIKKATYENAEILGLEKEIGSIEKGKYANMFLVNDNPFKDLRTLANPTKVFIKGSIINKPKNKKYPKFEEMLDTLI